MKRLVLALGLAALFASCEAGPDRLYQMNDLQLLTRYAAKEMCSCLFVMERDEDWCAHWTKQSPNLRTYRVNRQARIVETQAVLSWTARARWVSPRRGCVLE